MEKIMMRQNKSNKKIIYRLGMSCSDRMSNHKDISFEFLVPIQFDTPEEAEDNQCLFFAKMELADDETVINIYMHEVADYNTSKVIRTIRWQNWIYYKCTITKEESIGKLCIDPNDDEEPCAMKFSDILPLLTDKNSFSLQFLAYWVEPSFFSNNILSWNNLT